MDALVATKHLIKQIWCNIQQILYYSLLSAYSSLVHHRNLPSMEFISFSTIPITVENSLLAIFDKNTLYYSKGYLLNFGAKFNINKNSNFDRYPLKISTQRYSIVA